MFGTNLNEHGREKFCDCHSEIINNKSAGKLKKRDTEDLGDIYVQKLNGDGTKKSNEELSHISAEKN